MRETGADMQTKYKETYKKRDDDEVRKGISKKVKKLLVKGKISQEVAKVLLGKYAKIGKLD